MQIYYGYKTMLRILMLLKLYIFNSFSDITIILPLLHQSLEKCKAVK